MHKSEDTTTTTPKPTKRRKSSGIQQKLLLAVIPLFILSFAIMLFMSYQSSSKALINATNQSLLNEADSNVKTVTIDLLRSTGSSDINSAYNLVIHNNFQLTLLYDSLSCIKVLDVGYTFLIDSNTMEINAHPSTSIRDTLITSYESNSFLGQVTEKILAGDTSLETIKDGTEPYLTTISYVDGTPWILVSCIPESYVLSDVQALLVRMAIACLIILAVAILIISIVIRKIIKPIHTLTDVLTTIADGDFSVSITPTGNDEITVMSHALHDFVNVMREIIRDINDISIQLTESSNATQQISGTLNKTSEVQADSMSDMKITMDQVANAIQELALHASTLSDVVTSTNQQGSQASASMQDTVDVAARGRDDMEIVNRTMTSIVSAMKNLESKVIAVGASTEQINAMVNLISDIATQTNLLSLNAAIEAARAGEAGRGFAVVADEIRKLADESSESASNIANIIAQVNAQVDSMVIQTSQNVSYIEDNSAKITSACDIFETIYNDVNNANNMVNNIVEQIAQVDDVATNIAALSEEQSASTEEILASTEVLAEAALQFNSDSSSVSKNADKVSEAAFTLSEHMRRFKI